MIVRIQRRLYRRLAHHAQRVHLKGRACRCRESFHQECRIPPHQKAAVTQGRVSLRQIGNRRVQSVADLPHGRKALIDQRRFRNARVVGNISERLCALGHCFSPLESASLTQWCALGSRLRFHRLDRLGHLCLLHSFFEPPVPLVFIPLHHGLHLERSSHRGSPPVVVTVSSLARTFCFLGRRPTLCGFPTEGSPAGVYM